MKILKLTFVLYIISLNVVGCATPTQVGNVNRQSAERQEIDGLLESKAWWYVRFRMEWPEQSEPQWYLGALLGGEVIAPLVDQYQQHIDVWRIHRRAVRDESGHQFSFIFYSSVRTARELISTLKQNTVLHELKLQHKILSTGFDDPQQSVKTAIADSSDPHWPLAIQKTWPRFMMGASQMWLNLVTELAGSSNRGELNEQRYRDVQQQITQLWREQGQHAWLHHLSGIYAYQPILIRY